MPGPIGSARFAVPAHSATSRGVVVSIASSVLFGAVYFMTPLLAPLSAESIWAIRTVITLPFVTVVLVTTRGWPLISGVWYRIRRQPALLLGVVACGILLAAQLWIFAWAPLHGRGLQVALGYFLLPLVLVVLGRVIYGDRLRWWQWVAAAVALVGVGYEVVRIGGVSWETLLVALGYALYFVLRRSLGTGHLGGMWWEMAVVSPVAVVLVVIEISSGSALSENPALVWGAPAFALLTAFALLLYLLASRLLSLSLFGLLSYVEPALLVVASVLIGERIASGEWFTYGAIWAAVLVLLVGGATQMLRGRSQGPGASSERA